MSDDVLAVLKEIRDELRKQNRLLASHSRATLSISAAAKLVGIDRKDLAAAVAAGRVRSVVVGVRPKVPREEVERIARVGLHKPEAAQRRRQKAKPQRSVGDAIRAIPLPSERPEELDLRIEQAVARAVATSAAAPGRILSTDEAAAYASAPPRRSASGSRAAGCAACRAPAGSTTESGWKI